MALCLGMIAALFLATTLGMAGSPKYLVKDLVRETSKELQKAGQAKKQEK